MSTGDTQMTKRNPSSNIASILVVLIAIAIILGALITNFKLPLTQILFKIATETPPLDATSLPVTSPLTVDVGMPATTENTFSSSVETVDQYYRYINNAGNSDDLGKAWAMMMPTLKCNPGDRCNFVRFQSHWWQLKAQYKLYECGSNTINAEVIYYPRKSAGPHSSAQTEFIQYQVVDENGQMKLDKGELIEEIDAECTLAVTVP